ncbi:MAG TPA: hypothetical protein VG318_14340 [Actinomycetota bacterium]|nr:hypothetical protein [Actinomycetota bacterium]
MGERRTFESYLQIASHVVVIATGVVTAIGIAVDQISEIDVRAAGFVLVWLSVGVAALGLVAGKLGGLRVLVIALVPTVVLALAGLLLLAIGDTKNPPTAQGGSPQRTFSEPKWPFMFFEGVGDTDRDKAPELLVVDLEGDGVLYELGVDGDLEHPSPTSHDWSAYDLITGLGDLDDDGHSEIFVATHEDGWLLRRAPDGGWTKDPREFGRTWDHDVTASVADVDDSHAPEILGINWGDRDDLMYIGEGGIYDPDLHRYEEVKHLPDYDRVTGLGDFNGDGRPDVLAILGKSGRLLDFCPNATYVSTRLSGSWDYDFITNLKVFGEAGESQIVAVENGEVEIVPLARVDVGRKKCPNRT